MSVNVFFQPFVGKDASWCLARATIVMRAVPTVATWLIIVSAGRLPMVVADA